MSRAVYFLGVATGMCFSLPCMLEKRDSSSTVHNIWHHGAYVYEEKIVAGKIVDRSLCKGPIHIMTLQDNDLTVHRKEIESIK